MAHNANGVTRGDRNRNRRLDQLREVVREDCAILSFDLAERKQSAVVCDHDSRVLARKKGEAGTWELGPWLRWGLAEAHQVGYSSVVVACEPTGHRWMVLDQLAMCMGLELVCVQPLLVGRSRTNEGYSSDKTDDKDAVVIARLVSQLCCYVPDRSEEPWARLRHLGIRRNELIEKATACEAQLRDLLGCVWPAALRAAGSPFESTTWLGALTVAVSARGDLGAVHGQGPEAFEARVRAELGRWGAKRPSLRILRAVFDALCDPVGVLPQRKGALERVAWILEDLRACRHSHREVEPRMLEVLEELGLSEVAGSIWGLSSIGAAQILALSGDPSRLEGPRSLVKLAGLNPIENTSGEHEGLSRLSRRGRPGLRLAVWRAIWAALRNNEVFAARFEHLTTRATNPLAPGRARAAIAAALLRQFYVVVTQKVSWDPAIAAGVELDAQAA